MRSMAHQFLDFCRSKPADESYDYWNTSGCALCLFARERLGIAHPRAGGDYWRDTKGGPDHRLPEVAAGVVCDEPYTFGALADRLENALAAPPAHKAREAGI